MQLKIGDILKCVKEYESYDFNLKCEVDEYYTIATVDNSDQTYELRKSSDYNGGETWIHWCKNCDRHFDFGYVWNHFETKTDRAKRIIEQYESRRHNNM